MIASLPPPAWLRAGATAYSTPASAALFVPPAVAAGPPVAKPVWMARKVVPDAVELNPGTVALVAGETLDKVAVRTRVPVGALAATNGLAGRPLVAGQSLKVPGGRVHTVHAGESGIWQSDAGLAADF